MPHDQTIVDGLTIMENTVPTEAFGRRVEALATALRTWHGETPARPSERRGAASTAVAEVDGMLHELHVLREQLVGETRAFDDALLTRLAARSAS